MALLFTMYLILVVALPLTLGMFVSFRALPNDRRCPQCGGETISILTRLTRVARHIPGLGSFQRRWCSTCLWEGYTRLQIANAETEAQPVIPEPVIPRSRVCTQAVRTLEMAGKWRVLLQCWDVNGGYYGRLLFVSPTGRTWVDPQEPFTGSTRQDVLAQALSLSDGLLTYRLRELVSD